MQIFRRLLESIRHQQRLFSLHPDLVCADRLHQRNAFVLTALIDRFRSTNLSGAGRLVIVGESMGGLVARYALAHMESAQRPHGVKLFVSVDSPHRGAYVPIGIQFLAVYFAREWKNASARRMLDEQIDSPAARQMLLWHYSQAHRPAGPFTDLYSQLYLAELRIRLKNYPSESGMRMVAITNGRNGGWDGPAPGSLLLRWQSPRIQVDRRTIPVRLTVPTSVPIVGGTVLFERRVTVTSRACLDVRAYALSGSHKPQTVFATHPVFTMNNRPVDYQSTAGIGRAIKAIIAAEVPGTPNVAGFSPRRVWNDQGDHVVRPYAAAASAQVRRYLHANPRYKPRAVVVESAFAHEGAPGGRSNKTHDAAELLRGSGTIIGTVQRNHNFIPTLSALGIEREPNFSLQGLGDALGPFAKVYTHNTNTGHMEGSVHEFLRQEIARLMGAP